MSMVQPFGLPLATLDKLNSVFAQHSAIENVLIYGSRAKGDYRLGSDIDLTIKGGDYRWRDAEGCQGRRPTRGPNNAPH
jgi:predicted nucleotidyltransferase